MSLRTTGDSVHKTPVVWKAFPCHDLVMWMKSSGAIPWVLKGEYISLSNNMESKYISHCSMNIL